MKRTQLYLDDELWNRMHAEAELRGSTISELAREAMRAHYFKSATTREQAMKGIIGLWSDRTDLPDTEQYVRSLRSGSGRSALLET